MSDDPGHAPEGLKPLMTGGTVSTESETLSPPLASEAAWSCPVPTTPGAAR